MKTKPKRRRTPAQPGSAPSTPRSVPETADGLPAWLQRWRGPLLVLLYALLALNFIRLPKVAVDMAHDLGSDMSFEFYAHAKYQFGVDVIQNVGPYGYLQNPYSYSGIMAAQKLVFGVLFGLTVAWLAFKAREYFATMKGKVIWFLALFFALVMPQQQLDPVADLFMLLAAHHLLLAERKGRNMYLPDALVCVFLALLFLMKSTNVMLIGLLMVLVTVERVRRRRFADLTCNLGCVGLTALVLWTLAGQKLSNVFAFVRGAVEFSKGYNEALAQAGNPAMVWLAAGAIGLFAAFNIIRLLQFRTYAHRFTTSVLESASVFLIWKHGYVRADHAAYFWAFFIISSPLLFLAHERPSARGKSEKSASTPPAGAGVLGTKFSMYQLGAMAVVIAGFGTITARLVGSDDKAFAGYASPVTAVSGPVVRIAGNFWELVDLPAHLQALKSQFEANRATAVLPDAKKAIGGATVDEFGYLPGAILLNGLNYHPRPMPINFAATTEMMMQRNADFYRSDATGPAYLLANIGQIDGRLAPQDDALALLEVLARYQPQLVDNAYILLKRTPGQPNPERVLQDTKTIAWGERVPLPSPNGKMLWCSVDIDYTLRGRAESFLLRPPPAYIVLESGGRRFGPIRVLPSGAHTGFLLRPLILNPIDFLTAYGIRAEPVSALTPPMDSIVFVTMDTNCFKPDLKLSFWDVELKK